MSDDKQFDGAVKFSKYQKFHDVKKDLDRLEELTFDELLLVRAKHYAMLWEIDLMSNGMCATPKFDWVEKTSKLNARMQQFLRGEVDDKENILSRT